MKKKVNSDMIMLIAAASVGIVGVLIFTGVGLWL